MERLLIPSESPGEGEGLGREGGDRKGSGEQETVPGLTFWSCATLGPSSDLSEAEFLHGDIEGGGMRPEVSSLLSVGQIAALRATQSSSHRLLLF